MTIREMTTDELLVLCDEHGITIFNYTADLRTLERRWRYGPQSQPAERSGDFDTMRAAALAACMHYGIRPERNVYAA